MKRRYIGLYGQQYGAEDAQGLSPTEREFDLATANGKPRLVFVKGVADKGRHPKMATLVRKAGAQLVRRRFSSAAKLKAAVYASLVEWLDRQGVIQNRPFEDRPVHGATLDEIDGNAVVSFIRRARSARQFPLAEGTPLIGIPANYCLH